MMNSATHICHHLSRHSGRDSPPLLLPITRKVTKPDGTISYYRSILYLPQGNSHRAFWVKYY